MAKKNRETPTTTLAMPPIPANPDAYKVRIGILQQCLAEAQLLNHYFQKEPKFEIHFYDRSHQHILDHRYPIDVIIFDFELLGLQASRVFLRQLEQHYPRTKPIIFSRIENPFAIVPLLQAGAFSYVSKHAGIAILTKAIINASLGRNTIIPSITDTRALRRDIFTSRELDVLEKAATSGESNEKIAKDLSIDVKTVKAHFSRMLAKMHMSSRTQLVLFAISIGLVSPEHIVLHDPDHESK